jgi:hypothetical protein
MNYVNKRQGTMTVKQTNNKLSLTVKGTSGVDKAIDLFSGILAYHESTIAPGADR